jgi:hypothetical protein
MNIENVNIEIGNYITPDEWKCGGKLIASDNYSDEEFPGCQFRLESANHTNVKYAVNVKITGRKINYDLISKRVRVEIEFVGDGEPSTKTHGWMFIQ